jgi:hypothetical protein
MCYGALKPSELAMSPCVFNDLLGKSLHCRLGPNRNVSSCWRGCGSILDAFLYHPRFPFLSNPILEGFVHSDVDGLTQIGAGMCSTSTPKSWIWCTTEAIMWHPCESKNKIGTMCSGASRPYGFKTLCTHVNITSRPSMRCLDRHIRSSRHHGNC